MGTSHHRDRRGRFRNPWPDSEPPGLGKVLLWSWRRHTTERPRPDPDPSVFESTKPRFGSVTPGGLAVTWIGHSTLVIELDGATVLTDPMWGTHAAPIALRAFRRWVPPPVPLEGLPRIDAVVLSHGHYDHLDKPTVRAFAKLQPDAVWCVPLGHGHVVRRFGVRRVFELDWWEECQVGFARIAASPARHFTARGPFDKNRALWCGFAIRSGARGVYFAGDTAFHPTFGEIGRRLGPFDVQILPVGAYDPRWFMHVVHMTPEESVAAFREMGAAAAMVPVHWGTFKLTDEPMDEPPRRTVEAWSAAGLEPARLWLLKHGETRTMP
jgi:N-acyl-phosphatidylethanolamine-hydrolysing phospholipase D